MTILLTQLREGNQEASNKLIPLIYRELRRRASTCIASGPVILSGHRTGSRGLPRLSADKGRGRTALTFRHCRTHAGGSVGLCPVSHAASGGDGVQKVEIDDELLIANDKLENVIAMDGCWNGWHRLIHGRAA